MKNVDKIGLIAFLIIITTGIVNAQQNIITLSGTILCEDDAKGALSFVNIYNKNTKKGTVSDINGKFSIKMGKSDTILFSTVQHVEQLYYIKEKEIFEDKSIEISMVQDTVWLGVISVIGFKEFENFKEEVLQLKLPDNDISLALPIIDKYAKQNASGVGVIIISGPLTYLTYKILTVRNRKK